MFARYFWVFTLCLVAYAGLAVAQPKQAERAGAGNTSAASATSRMEITRENVVGFVGQQNTIISGRETTINTLRNTLTTRLGVLTQTLVTYNPNNTSTCSPNAGPHGCSCACPTGSKILWTGNEWRCYQAQLPQCPTGQQFDPATCRCKVACVPPPGGCPPGYHWDPVTCQCKCDAINCVCPPPRVKDQYGICRCGPGFNECRIPGVNGLQCVQCDAPYTMNPNTCQCEIDCGNNPGHPLCGGQGGGCSLSQASCGANLVFNPGTCTCDCLGGNCGGGGNTCPTSCPPGYTLAGCSCRPINNPNNCPPGQAPGPNGTCLPLCP